MSALVMSDMPEFSFASFSHVYCLEPGENDWILDPDRDVEALQMSHSRRLLSKIFWFANKNYFPAMFFGLFNFQTIGCLERRVTGWQTIPS
jgi:hypothetical protein